MYSEMIRTLDHNTLKFIVEELQQKFEEEHTARETERVEKEAAVRAVQAERAAKEKALAEIEELKNASPLWMVIPQSKRNRHPVATVNIKRRFPRPSFYICVSINVFMTVNTAPLPP